MKRCIECMSVSVIFVFLTASCSLNVKREAPMTNVDWRVGLKDATIVHGTASLPNEFEMDIGSDVTEWLIDGAVSGGTQGMGAIAKVVDYAFGWLVR